MYTGIRLLLIHPFISSFYFLSNFQTLKVFDTLFSGTTSHTKVKPGTYVDNSLVYRVYWNQTAALLIHPLILHSGTVRLTKLILGTHVDNGLMCCVYQNQNAAAYSSL